MTRTTRLVLLYGVFAASGVAGLGYQMVWARLFAVGLGHEVPSMLAVVAAFFGGLALGAWALDRRVSVSARPAHWYAGLELLIGLWALVTLALVLPINAMALSWIGVDPHPLWHWFVAFALPFALLLPATAAMGATLPAIERYVAPMTGHGRVVGGLYASNTLGAVVGTVAGAFVLVPMFGLSRTIVAFALVNVICAAVVSWIAWSMRASKDLALADKQPVAPAQSGNHPNAAARSKNAPAPSGGLATTATTTLSPRRLGVIVFFTGLLGIGYEVLGVRMAAQVMENTVYSFAAALVVYLLGTTLGAAWYQRFGRQRRFRPLLAFLLGGLSATCLLGTLMLSAALDVYQACVDAFGDGQWPMIAAEFVIAVMIFALPTLFMGATFSHLVQASKRADGGIGRAMALNTLGAALAPPVVGVVLLPTLGAKAALMIVALTYPLLIALLRPQWQTAPRRPSRRPHHRVAWAAGVALLATLTIAALGANLQLLRLQPGQTIADYRQGVMATVVVVESDGPPATPRQPTFDLCVNGNFRMGSTAALQTELRQGHIPLLLHPAPRRALFLGLGTGITFHAAAFHHDLHADGVELLPGVVDVMPRFSVPNMPADHDQRLTVYTADARRFVAATAEQYDVIVADLFHPGRDGAGSLYTLEHYRAIRRRLRPGGLCCQWLPLYQLDLPTLRVIVRTFIEVFPHIRAWIADYEMATPVLGLIATDQPQRYDHAWFDQRTDPQLREHLSARDTPVGPRDALSLLGLMMFDARQLHDFAADAPINTDDRPIVTYWAPRHAYHKRATPFGRLLALMDQYKTNTDTLLPAPADTAKPAGAEATANTTKTTDAPGNTAAPANTGDLTVARAFAQQLDRYIEARDVFLRGQVHAMQGRQQQAVDAFIRSAAISRQFTPAYSQCISIIMQLRPHQPAKARRMLLRLIDAQPANPFGQLLLQQWFPPGPTP